MKRWLIEKDLWFIIEDKSDLNTLNSIIDIISEIQSLDFESQKIDVKAHYWLIICIIIDDQEHTANKMSAKEIWDTLSYKYKEKLQIIKKQYLMNFINYRMSTNISIEKTWTHLIKLTWKIITTQNDMSDLFKSEHHFQVLLQLLSDEYMIIQDIIDAQNKSNVKKELQKLQEKKAQLKITETALWIKRRNERERTDQEQNKCKISHRCKCFSNFDNDQSRHWFLKCFLCKDKHCLVDCSHLFAAQELVKKCKDKNKTRHKSIDDLQILAEFLKSKYKKHRVYNAKSDSEISDDDKNDENEESKNIAALLKNIVSKIFKFNWIADSDVFLHMIDQLWLFSESLICIKRCIIKVEEEKLYVNHCDTAVMWNHHENSIKLFSVLHVSKLKMNLLSERRMCKKDLQESFDDKDLYMHNKWEK